MADNFVANAGSGGSTFASDDIGSVHYPRVKIGWGADGSYNDPAVATPVPVQATQEGGQLAVAGVLLTIKYKSIAAGTSGNNTIVDAVTSKKIRVLSCWMNAAGTVNAKFQSGASGTDLTGLLYMVVNTGMVLPFNQGGWFESAAGVLLNLNLSATIAVGGSLSYVEV